MFLFENYRKSFRFKIFVSTFLLVTSTILIISVVMLNQSSETLESELSFSQYRLIEQVNENIEFYLMEMENISNLTHYNYNIQKYLKNSNPANDLERFKDANDITNLISNIISVRKDIVSVFLFGDNGYVLRINPHQKLIEDFSINSYSWNQEATRSFGDVVFSAPHYQDYLQNSSRQVVSLSRVIQNFDSMESLGVVLIDLNLKVIKDICEKASKGSGGYIYIFDDQKNLIYHPTLSPVEDHLEPAYWEDIVGRDQGSLVKTIHGEKKFITFTTSKKTGWKIVNLSSYDLIAAGTRDLRKWILLIGLFSSIALFFIVSFVSSKMTSGLTNLEQKMRNAGKGDLTALRVESNSGDEIDRLSRRFNRMIEQINKLMGQVVIEQEKIRKTELELLHAQIKPHFLYNTLGSIIWMAENNENEAVVEMVSALSKLFQISLSKGEEVISVKSEIEHVTSYLVIQKMRYKQKFDYILDVDPDVLEKKTLKLLLQPLVENALYHGIKQMRTKGLIKIVVTLEADKLVYKVIDNGPGIDMEKVEALLEGEQSFDTASGVGIRNIHERIQLYYGKSYGLRYKSKEGIGTSVTVEIPIQEEARDE